jgi:hypothetical protein
MRIIREQKGAVTVYLAIIFMAMIVLTGIFVDLARIRLAQNQLRRITNSAARSVMADYDISLKNQYGLFAVKTDMDVRGEFRKYIKANLEESLESGFKLLDCRYEDSDLVLSQPISNLASLKLQILEDMKYSAPIEITKELIEKFKAISNLAQLFEEQNQKRKNIKSTNAKIGDISEINNEIDEKKNRIKQDKLLLKQTNEQINLLLGKPENAARIKNLQEQKSEITRRIIRDKEEISAEINRSKNIREEIQQEIDQLANWNITTENTADRLLQKEIQNNLVNFKKENLDTLGSELQEIKNNTERAEIALAGITTDDKPNEDLLAKLELDPDKKMQNKYNNSSLSGYQELLGKLTASRNVYMNRFANNQLLQNSKITEEQMTDIVDYRTVGETDRKLETQEQMFKQISDILNTDKKLSDMRNELYLNEYLLTHCSFITSEPKGNSNYDKRNMESEYVLFGSHALEKTIRELYITRFALDTLGYMVFSKPPAPVELLSRTIYSLIMGAMHASVDTYKLLSDSENTVCITEVAPDNPMENLNFTLSYKDHLRLFMLLHSDEQGKLERLMEVISQRDGIDTQNAFTLSAGNAIISIKLWFLPLTGLNNIQNGPFDTEIRDGRCYIIKNVEFGY